MAWKLWERTLSLFQGGENSLPPAEVAVATCTLEEMDPGVCRKVAPGRELRLETLENRTAAYCGKELVGFIPKAESAHVSRLVEQGAALGCRVVRADGKIPEIRVRICVRM